MGEQDEGRGAGQQPLPELGRGGEQLLQGWAALKRWVRAQMAGAAKAARSAARLLPLRWLRDRFRPRRLGAGLVYCYRALKLGKRLAIPAVVIFLALAWGFVDSGLLFRALPASEQRERSRYESRYSASALLRRAMSRDLLLGAPRRGLHHQPILISAWLVLRIAPLPPEGPRDFWFDPRLVGAALPNVLATWALVSFLIVMLSRSVRRGSGLVAPLRVEFAKRAPPWLALCGCALMGGLVMFGLIGSLPPESSYWLILAYPPIAAVLVLLMPYTMVGLGLGFRRGIVGALRLLWRYPGEVLVLLVVTGVALGLVRPLGWRDSTAILIATGKLSVAQAVGRATVDLLLTVPLALVTAWTMAAFLLFVMDHAEEAGARVEAQAANAPLSAKEPA